MYTYFQEFLQLAQNNSVMFVLIVIISFVAIFIFTVLLLNPKAKPVVNARKIASSKPHSPIQNQDIQAISGDDVFVTQLDLARAYIELGDKTLARQILTTVIHQGDQQQKQAAQELLHGI